MSIVTVKITSFESDKSFFMTLYWIGVKPVKPSKMMTLFFIRSDDGSASQRISSVSSVVMYFPSMYLRNSLYKRRRSLSLAVSAPFFALFSQSSESALSSIPYIINSEMVDFTSSM